MGNAIPQLRKNVKTDGVDVLVERREKMVSILCEVCKDNAEIESWNGEQIEDGACSPCFQKLKDKGLVDD